MSKLQGKIAVITGGNSGIGLATAAEFVAKAHMSSSPVILFGITAPIGAVMPTPAWQRRYRLGLFPSQPGRMPDGGIVLLCGAGVPGFTAYSATKAAIRSFARTWTLDLKDRKIRVNVISPGPIDTPIWSSTNLPEEVVEDMKKQIVSRVPANEMGRSEDVAKAASFLASNDARFIRGIELFVDGGMASM